MPNRRVIRPILGLTAVAALVAACNRQPSVPPESQTTAMRARTEPVSVTGCLKGGALAEDTFVLTSSKPDTSGTTLDTTYELIGGDAAMLRGHLGEQVQV